MAAAPSRDRRAFSRNWAPICSAASSLAILKPWRRSTTPPPLLTVRSKVELLRQPDRGDRQRTHVTSANGVHREQRPPSHRSWGHRQVVVSGLARGIDAAAHRGFPAPREESTIMAGRVRALDLPRREHRPSTTIAAQWRPWSTKLPPGLTPQARHFPQRNRIVSGLASGVVVVEAALKSGSLITARLAPEPRPGVFAVPGSPLDPQARGSRTTCCRRP